jgi:hypothetical protein
MFLEVKQRFCPKEFDLSSMKCSVFAISFDTATISGSIRSASRS